MTRLLVTLIPLLLPALGACGEEPAAAIAGSAYAQAVTDPARPAADRERDAGRKPAEVLEFFAIRPGMEILDLFSGGGYYTEILARLVAPDGRVVAHANEATLNFVGDEFAARYADDRLGNVAVLMAENNELRLDPDAFDVILMILSYHDIFWVAPDQGWPQIDGEQLRAELFKALRPGGVLGVVDHRAEAGAPPETGGSLHRIDPGIVIAELQRAGFVLDAQSDLLRNSDDDLGKGVFDPSVRGRTDRFVLRFVKPE